MSDVKWAAINLTPLTPHTKLVRLVIPDACISSMTGTYMRFLLGLRHL